MENNTLIGVNAGKNIKTAKNCVCIGKDSGLDITSEDNQIRIGNGASRGADDVVITGANENIIITKEVWEFIFSKEVAEKVYAEYGSSSLKD